MNPADAAKASHLREADTLVWNFRCSAELLWLSLAGEQKFKPLSSFSAAYIVLAKSQFEVKETPFYQATRKTPCQALPCLPHSSLAGLLVWFLWGFVCFEFSLVVFVVAVVLSKELSWQFKQIQKLICIYIWLENITRTLLPCWLGTGFSPKCFANFQI